MPGYGIGLTSKGLGACVLVILFAIVPTSLIANPSDSGFRRDGEPGKLEHTGYSTDMDSQVIGPTYPIWEEDLSTVLKKQFEVYEQSHPGGLKHAWLSRVTKTLENIEPKQRLPRVTRYRFWYENPTIVLKRDITDENNRVIAARGTVINPLMATPLNETLVFFDADDPEQIKFVKRTLKQDENNHTPDKLIVVQGNIIAAQKQLKHRLYVDQHGELTKYFHLQRLPTRVKQVRLRLKLEECPMLATSNSSCV